MRPRCLSIMACFWTASGSVAGTALDAWMMEHRTMRGMLAGSNRTGGESLTLKHAGGFGNGMFGAGRLHATFLSGATFLRLLRDACQKSYWACILNQKSGE